MRKDWIKWYLDIAQIVSEKSKDPSTAVGAVIINKKNRPISFGFNGFIAKCDETYFSWDNRPIKYMGVVHAEKNAMDFANCSLEGAIIFCTHGPCDECLKSILNREIRTFYYRDASIIKERGTDIQKEAIYRLIKSTDAMVVNENGMNYLDELNLN